MYEAHKIITDILGLFQFTDISQFLLPKVGVGAEIEAKEIVSIAPLLKYTLIFLAGMSTVFGFVLAFAAKKFAVKIDPRVEQVNDVLAHAHCGACGYAGCEQYAEAVVKDPNVSPSLCIPAGEKAARDHRRQRAGKGQQVRSILPQEGGDQRKGIGQGNMSRRLV